MIFQQGPSAQHPDSWLEIFFSKLERNERVPLAKIQREMLEGIRFLYTVNDASGVTMSFSICKLLPDAKSIWLGYLASRESWQGYGKFLMENLVPTLQKAFPTYETLVWDINSPTEASIDDKESTIRLDRQRFYDNLRIGYDIEKPSEYVEYYTPAFDGGNERRQELRWIRLDPSATANPKQLGNVILRQIYGCPEDNELVHTFLASFDRKSCQSPLTAG